MIAVFSAYREPPGEWTDRLNVAQQWADQAGEELFSPVGEHTRHEAEMMVAECVRRGEKKLLAITSPDHTLRAEMTIIKVLIDRGLERTIHLQSVSATSERELEKIDRYRALGHVATQADFDSYVNWWETCVT